ncbi:hypothetical protein SODG_005876 [Sodalis praecaptivus]
MTFSEIEAALYNTGRRGYAGSVLAFCSMPMIVGTCRLKNTLLWQLPGSPIPTSPLLCAAWKSRG